MKPTTVLVLAWVLVTPTFLAVAQRGGIAARPIGMVPQDLNNRGSRTLTSGKKIDLQANKEQQTLLARCEESAGRVHKVADEMIWPGRRWYFDRAVFPGQKQDLQEALTEMAAAHDQFRQSLRPTQEKELARHLAKLERLDTEIQTRNSAIGSELETRKPDRWSLYSDVHRIGELARKWRSEYRQIAKEVGVH